MRNIQSTDKTNVTMPAERKGLLEAFRFKSMGVAVLFAGFAFMVLVYPTVAFDKISRWRGFILCIVCRAMVFAAAKMSVSCSLAKLAGNFGDATYGCYLLYPVLFFGLLWIIFPCAGITNRSEWAVYARLIFDCSVIGLAFWLALLKDRHFKKPVRLYFNQKTVTS